MTPTFTRGPGETLGVFTLETAMDELAHELGIDPVELRLRNHTPDGPAREPVVERRARGVPAARRRAVRLVRPRPGAALAPATATG